MKSTRRRGRAEEHACFLRRLHHEINNSLTVLQAGLANMGESSEPSAAASSLPTLRQEVGRLTALAKQLGRMAELDLRQLVPAPVDLRETIEEAVEVARLAPGRDDRLPSIAVSGLSSLPIRVRGDHNLLHLALVHLLDNALKFSPADSPVEVRVRKGRTAATIEVRDAGPGIADEDLPHVAEPLYRGRSAPATEGFGMGLAFVERIAALHGGSMRIDSPGGHGTVVALRLPVSRSSPEAP